MGLPLVLLLVQICMRSSAKLDLVMNLFDICKL
jgi:hypothetical protein